MVVNREIKQQDGTALSLKLQIARSVQRTSFRARTTQVFYVDCCLRPKAPDFDRGHGGLDDADRRGCVLRNIVASNATVARPVRL
jgi:hypothetical protein